MERADRPDSAASSGKERMIYLDNAATTRTSEEVVKAMLPYFSGLYGNASAVYSFAGKGREAVRKARMQIAEVLGADKDEIFFTSGGTESDNWALKAVCEARAERGRHLITTCIEHPAILNTCRYLEGRGFEVTYLNTDAYGMIRMEDLEKAIRPDTILISIMTANNEIGTIQPIRQVGALAHRHGILFHTDAVQAFGQIPIHTEEMGIDLLSASAHKLHGPKGVGFLYVRRGTGIGSFLHGGGQERGKRAGTLNVPGIVGAGEAARIAQQTLQQRMEKVSTLRDHLIARVLEEIPLAGLNGHPTQRLPGNAHFSFPYAEGTTILIMLDADGICASSGSACAAGTGEASYVLRAIGLDEEASRGSIRLTLSEETTLEELDTAVDALQRNLRQLRSISEEYQKAVKNSVL